MAQTELEQIAMAMMMMAEEPARLNQPMSATAAVCSPQRTKDARSFSSTDGKMHIKEEVESCEEESGGERNGFGENGQDTEDEMRTNSNYSINPNSLSTPSPSSPAGSLRSTSSGGGEGSGRAGRRIFTLEFKQRVYDAFTNDPECIGNQRATARKFNIHRRQVQKWLQQLAGHSDNSNKDQQSSDEQEQKVKNDTETDSSIVKTTKSLASSRRSILSGKCVKSKSRAARSTKSNKMPIVAGKGPSIPQASAVSSSPTANLPSSSPLTNSNRGKGMANIHHPLFSNNASNLFMGLTSPMLSLPLAMEASNRNNSPPQQSPPINGGHENASPPINGSLSSNAQKMLELVDELCYLYPSEDFSLLRKAMLKNEVTFTKLPIRKSNGRRNSSSPTPSANDYITQQTLQMIRNQNEYLQLLQSGYVNLSQFQEIANDASNGKYASWLANPFAAAAVAGFQGVNKNGGLNGKKSNNDSHNFASPKPPTTNSKSKTVAAVLAATRNGPTTNQRGQPNDKTKRPGQRRKQQNGRAIKQSSPNMMDDDFFDPTSMLEVVTSKPSPVDNNGNNGESFGMDLSTNSSSSVIQRNSSIRSKAMNKDYGFLSELGLVRKDDSDSTVMMINMTNGHTSPPSMSTSSLEHFVDTVLSHRSRSSPQTSSSGSPVSESLDSSKDSVLEAFNFDPEVAGDARAVARKFGLNIRVVQKWIREAPTRSIPVNGNGGGPDGGDTDEAEGSMEDVNENLLHFQKGVIASTSNGPTVNKRKNPKPNQICDFRATTEDENDLDENSPLDMVVPIKKRRVSTPTPPTATSG